MKSSIALLLVICVVGVHSLLTFPNKEQQQKIKKDIDDCVNESGFDPTDDMKLGRIPPSNEKSDCFSACIFKKNGVMNEDGTINYKPTKLERKYEECNNLTGKDKCETAARLMACYHQNSLIQRFPQWKQEIQFDSE